MRCWCGGVQLCKERKWIPQPCGEGLAPTLEGTKIDRNAFRKTGARRSHLLKDPLNPKRRDNANAPRKAREKRAGRGGEAIFWPGQLRMARSTKERHKIEASRPHHMMRSSSKEEKKPEKRSLVSLGHMRETSEMHMRQTLLPPKTRQAEAFQYTNP